jgi:pyridoxal/pyridoxine/pyridoxamine kinase
MKGNYQEYKLKKSKIGNNINVLGAGDMFASFFIDNILSKNIHNNFQQHSTSDLKQVVKDSHLSTSNYLIKLNQRFKLM